MQKKTWGVAVKGVVVLIGIFLLSILAGLGLSHLSDQDTAQADTAVLVIIGVLAVLVMVASMWIGVAWMRSIDEAAQEAHKAAWYYGGSGGMAVGGVLFILASLPEAGQIAFDSFLPGRTDPAAYAATGAITILGFMMVGYTVVWLWWWWKRR